MLKRCTLRRNRVESFEFQVEDVMEMELVYLVL